MKLLCEKDSESSLSQLCQWSVSIKMIYQRFPGVCGVFHWEFRIPDVVATD